MRSRVTSRKVFVVALTVSLACSAVVTISTIVLRPVQEANRQHYMKVNILKVAGLLQDNVAVETQLRQLETRLVDLESGEFHDVENPEAYDLRKATRDPKQSIKLSATQDIAGIKRRAKYSPVYLVRDDNQRVKTTILPIHGYGLWSTLHGFVALQSDTVTVIGVRFYEHAETPGLGGEVDSPRWLAQWRGKKVFDSNWKPNIQLKKGGVAHDDPGTSHQVDALSGATVTSRGVENLLKFWLGDDGFGPFLARLRSSGGRP